MPIPWSLAACFIAGLVLIGLIGRLLIVPRRFFWRLIASGIGGALIILLINLLYSVTGFSIHLNAFTALAVGFLGIPGALMLIALTAIL